MTANARLFVLDKLEAEARAIIEPRRAIIGPFVRQLVAAHSPDVPADALDHDRLWIIYREIEPTLDWSAFEPLASQLDFLKQIQDKHIHRFYRTGMLWLPGHPPQRRPLPMSSEAAQTLLQQARVLLDSSGNVSDWIAAFVAQGICRDKDAAKRIAYALDKIPRLAANQARALLAQWLAMGDIGLLTYSGYPYLAELTFLHRCACEMSAQVADDMHLAAIITDVRTDVVTLAQTLKDATLVQHYQEIHHPDLHLYDESLWNQPPGSNARKRYQERLTDALRTLIVEHLAQRRECDSETASCLLDMYRTGGLYEVIRWRSTGHDPERTLHLGRARVQRAAMAMTQPLPEEQRQTILARLNHVQDAMEESGNFFPLHPLITDLPSSDQRKKQQRKRLPHQLIDTFAARAHLPESTARFLIKNLMVYGPHGLILPRQWKDLIHVRLWSYLHMVKLGRLEDTVHHSVLTERVHHYGQLLGCAALSKQLVIGLHNHFSKDNYFNSGDGEATAGVPLRKSLKLAGVARLNEEWLVLPVDLDIQLIGPAMTPVSDQCHALLIVDGGSQRPLTCTIHSHPICVADIGLALYHAIWHPQEYDWPIRGLPERILIPESLAYDGMADIHQAAYWLMATVQVLGNLKKYLDKHPYLKQLQTDLQAQYRPTKLPGRRRAPKQQMTIPQAREHILRWLRQHCFPNHRVKQVKKSIRDRGFALPGFDTLVAGYLLPIIATDVPTIRDGVTFAGYRYIDPVSEIEPGHMVSLRAMPPDTAGRLGTIFAEYGDPPVLHYLRFARHARIERKE